MAYRALATGFCFAVFGLGQLLLGLTVFPVILFLVREAPRRRKLAKLGIHYSFKAFVGLMRFTRVLDYRCNGLQRLERPGLLVLANHPSLIDVVFLISFLRQADCVVKGSLFKNPFIRFAVSGAGFKLSVVRDFLQESCQIERRWRFPVHSAIDPCKRQQLTDQGIQPARLQSNPFQILRRLFGRTLPRQAKRHDQAR